MGELGECTSDLAMLEMANFEKLPTIAVVGGDLLFQFNIVNMSQYHLRDLRITVRAARFSDYHIRWCSDNFVMDGDRPVTKWWVLAEQKCNQILYHEADGVIAPGKEVTGTIKVKLSGLTEGPFQRIRGVSVDWIPVRIVLHGTFSVVENETFGSVEREWGEITFAHTGNPLQRFITKLRDEWYEWLAIMMVGMFLGRLSADTFAQVLDTVRDAVNRVFQLLLTG